MQLEGLDAAEAERQTFVEFLANRTPCGEWATLYEDFLDAHAPMQRHTRGVFYTPSEVVGAQIRLVDEQLSKRLGCPNGFADHRVLLVDPAVGSGAYPLEVLKTHPHVRMRLFEPTVGAACVARALGLPVEERDALATPIGLDAPIVVCLGNPPYRRVTRAARRDSQIDDFLDRGSGRHAKNLYNEYVHFWRWAVRELFERRAGPAIVSLVTASSYVRGPAFKGMRCWLRRVLDELLIVDLEGDHLAARKTVNVFPIRTPVAIALGVRYAESRPSRPAAVQYTRLDGSREQKLSTLARVKSIEDLLWRSARSDWFASFAPPASSTYERWPRLTELFPWQLSGAQLKRTWPIGPTPDVLRERWRLLLEDPSSFGESRDRTTGSAPPDLRDARTRLQPLDELTPGAACIEPVRYAYRSFDRHWVLPDARLGDFMRPALWRIVGPRQIFLTGMLTNVPGPGPVLVATALVPDLDHFRGSFGARAVIPLWRDAAATQPNVASDWLNRLSLSHGFDVSAEALFAYCYGLLGTRRYIAQFEDELRTPGPRVPVTRDAALFLRAAALGERLLMVHTYRELARGRARIVVPMSDDYPRDFAYDEATQALCVGDARVVPVGRDVWAYSVSGMRVLPSWLSRRIKPKRRQSPLDAIMPVSWTRTMTDELLELVWLLEATLELEPALDAVLDEIVSGSLGKSSGPGGAFEEVADGVGA